MILHEYFSALLRIFSTVGLKLSSTNDRPIFNPCEKRKVLAIAPPIMIQSTFSIRFSRSSIFVEILAPPTTVATGLAGWPTTLSKALSSASINFPAHEGKYFAKPVVLTFAL